jgi:hypothetical protein
MPIVVSRRQMGSSCSCTEFGGTKIFYFDFVFTVHFLYITLINTPTKCTVDDRTTFCSLNSSTPTCFGAS